MRATPVSEVTPYPAGLVLTFMLFSTKIAVARLVMAVVAVSISGFLIEQLFTNTLSIPIDVEEGNIAPHLTAPEMIAGLLRSIWYVVIRTIPVLAVGVISSMLFVEYLPKESLGSCGF